MNLELRDAATHFAYFTGLTEQESYNLLSGLGTGD